MKNFLLLIIFIPLMSNAQSIDTFQSVELSLESRVFGIGTEEDFFPFMLNKSKATDQNYTMGLSLYWSQGQNKYFVTRLRREVNRIANFCFPRTKLYDYKFQAGGDIDDCYPSETIISINGAAFTPDSLQKSDISYNDRPYSFLLALSSTQTFISSDFTKARSYSLSLGVYGLRIGQYVQTWIHSGMNENDTKDPHEPKGWHNQIGDGIEPAFLYEYRYDRLLTKRGIVQKSRKSYFEMSYSYNYQIGYYTGFGGELRGRIGLLNPKNWWVKTGVLDNVNKKELKEESRSLPCEIYLFYTIKPSIILYNQSLSGGAFTSAYTIKPILEANPFIVEFRSGIATSIKLNKNKSNYINIIYSPFALRSPEMWGNKISRVHYWGGINVNFRQSLN